MNYVRAQMEIYEFEVEDVLTVSAPYDDYEGGGY